MYFVKVFVKLLPGVWYLFPDPRIDRTTAGKLWHGWWSHASTEQESGWMEGEGSRVIKVYYTQRFILSPERMYWEGMGRGSKQKQEM